MFLRSTLTVGGYTMASRVLGFLRDILIANYLGAGAMADAFVVAFRVPNLFRRLVAEGAFTAAFVPLFAGTLEREGREAALRFGNQALSMMLVILLALTLAAEAAMPWVIQLIAPGYSDEPAKLALTVELTRITFPYLLCMALVALLGGMLNSLYRFTAMSAAPILLNVVLTLAIVLGAEVWGAPGHALAWGVTIAGVIQLAWLILACRGAELAIALPRPRLTPGVRRLFRLMLPGLIGGGVTQINIVIGTAIATLVAEGAVSYLYYADRVYQLPLGVIGVALGTALLPLLARQIRGGDAAAAAASLNRALEFAALFVLPATAALLVISHPIVSVLFQRGAFGPADAEATARALAAYGFGLPAFVLVRVLATAFFARENTATPVRIAFFDIGVNIALSLALMGPLGHVGIAVATSAASWVNVALLLRGLARRGQLQLDAQLKRRALRILAASLAMGGALYGLGGWLAPGGESHALALVALVLAGIAIYGAAVLLLGGASLGDLRRQFGQRRA